MNPNIVLHLNSELCAPFRDCASTFGGVVPGRGDQGRTVPIAPAIDSLFNDFLELESMARTWTDHWTEGLALAGQVNLFSILPSLSHRDTSPLEAYYDDCPPPPSHWGINE